MADRPNVVASDFSRDRAEGSRDRGGAASRPCEIGSSMPRLSDVSTRCPNGRSLISADRPSAHMPQRQRSPICLRWRA